jgi:hypothetical protein
MASWVCPNRGKNGTCPTPPDEGGEEITVRFDLTMPCGDCPFRRVGGVRLTKSRIREIAGAVTDRQGATFSCHKSVDYSSLDEFEDGGDGDERIGDPPRDRTDEFHCAGALIFAEKNGRVSQMVRIAERLGLYDHTKFTEEAKALVFDDMREMLKTAIR